MNKTTGTAVVLTAIMVSVIFLPALQNSSWAKGSELSAPGMVWRLDLTKEQKENITNKENSVEKETLPLKQSLRDQRKELDVLLSADKPDNLKINKLIDGISLNMTEIQKKQIFFMLWIRQQLTAEQKQKLLSLIKSRQQTADGSREARGF